ncbi:orotidine-5'-phosphate decarboxylase [Oceanicoccus sagamiensis]|uniref:Orotidine 5'-phosphate decarboxylase n=1 Tax=Oceanicoccus sagamiensis TaxID=716816 RepID=A0A1X9NAE8_9GAMM|nr:orotidine-5'-phosphate decarboxylase [Oceanicoccus sagamiensis]ARN72905.1 orotidine 5'-phosphate decarboxylase [Oceanicoccus sagamiensis]
MTTTSPVIVAMDYSDLASVEALADQLDPSQCRLKVGKELFTHCGPQVVRSIQDRGFDVFLDLKFHDIPNTVAGAVKAAADLGVWMVNVHASGGARMMEAAKEALVNYSSAPSLIAVTVLTSMEQQDLQGIGLDCQPIDQVVRLARLTKECGLDGVVCSAQETDILRKEIGSDFQLVTPGIRPANAEQGDQRRVATPSSAMASGSSYLVIGRPITQHADPLAALAAINQELH